MGGSLIGFIGGGIPSIVFASIAIGEILVLLFVMAWIGFVEAWWDRKSAKRSP